MGKRLYFLGIFILMVLFIKGCSRAEAEEESTEIHPVSFFQGTILDFSENGAFVEPSAGEEILKSSDWIYFGTEELEEIDVEVGDLVSVTYIGDVMESYPAQVKAVSWSRVEKDVNSAD